MKKVFIASLLFSHSLWGSQDSAKVEIQVGAQFSDGNIMNKTITGGLNIFKKHGKVDWGVNPTYKYMKAYPYPVTSTSTPSLQNEFYMSSHVSYRNDSSWKFLAFSEVEHSRLRRINVRVNTGLGITKKLIHAHQSVLEISGVFLPDYFQTMRIKNTIPERDNLSLRISLRFKFVLKRDNFTISSVQLFQPAIYSVFYNSNTESVGWSDNLNFRSTNSIDFPISKKLSFGASFDWIYQSYLGYLAKDPEVQKTGIYLSPQDRFFSFYLKYKK